MCLVNRFFFFFLHLSALDSNNDISFQCFSFFFLGKQKRSRRRVVKRADTEFTSGIAVFHDRRDDEATEKKEEKKKALDILFLQSFFVFRGCLSNALGEDRSAFTVNLALLVLLFIYLFTYGLHKICIYMHMYMYLVIVLHCSLFFFF